MGIIYQSPWYSKDSSGMVYIYKDGYSGSVEEISLVPNTLEIRYSFSGWGQPVLKNIASFSFVNHSGDPLKYIDLLANEEKEYKLEITQWDNIPETLFSGFLNVEPKQQLYYSNPKITITASPYLSKLDNYSPYILKTLDYYSLIDLIRNSLSNIDFDGSIWTNMHIYPEAGWSGGQNIFNKVGVHGETFYKNNVEMEGSLTVIDKILSTLDGYLYYWDKSFYIEEFKAINDNPKKWYIFNNVDYPIDSSNALYTTTSDSSLNLQDYCYNNPLMITFTPGVNKIEVKTRKDLFSNMIVPWFNAATYESSTGEWLDPDARQMKIWDDPSLHWIYDGTPYYTINESLKRYESLPLTLEDRGIYTKFIVDVSDGTILNLKWKLGLETEYTSDEDIRVRWMLKDNYGNFILMDPTETFFYSYTSTSLEIGKMTVTYDDFDNKVYNVDISIPLSDTSIGFTGRRVMILGILPPTVYSSGSWDEINYVHFGDISITLNGQELEYNYSVAETNNNFLNVYEQTLELCDTSSYNYVNAFYRDNDNHYPVSQFKDFGTSNYYNLDQHIIDDRFQLYQDTRQTIQMDLKIDKLLRPFQLFYDPSQNKTFTLTDYTYIPEKGIYRNARLREYDVSTQINFT